MFRSFHDRRTWGFTECKFHGNRRFDDHIIDEPAVGFHCNELPADGIGAPRAGDNARHARAHGLFKTIIEGIDRIERAQLRGAGIGLLVNIIAFKAERILADANVRVRIDKSWQKPGASRVDHLAYRKLWELLHRARCDDFTF